MVLFFHSPRLSAGLPGSFSCPFSRPLFGHFCTGHCCLVLAMRSPAQPGPLVLGWHSVPWSPELHKASRHRVGTGVRPWGWCFAAWVCAHACAFYKWGWVAWFWQFSCSSSTNIAGNDLGLFDMPWDCCLPLPQIPDILTLRLHHPFPFPK